MNRISGISVQVRRILIVTVFTAGAFGATTRIVAQAPPDSPAPLIDKDIARLIDELNADTRAHRASAEQRLLDLGPRILPLLPAPELLPTAAVREAVRRIRVELERRKAVDSARASRVTLRGERTLPEWLEEIRRQTENRVELDSSFPTEAQRRKLPLDLDNADFWPALDEVSRAASKTAEAVPPLVSQYTTENRLNLSAKAETASRLGAAITHSGPFRILAKPAQRRPVFGNADRQLVRIDIEIAAEPRLRPLFLQFAATDFVARTDSGMPLKPYSPEARQEILLSQGRRTANWHADFDVPASWKGSSLELRGKATMTTAAESEPIRFTDLQELVGNRGVGVARRRGGVTVTLNRVLSERSADGGANHADVRIQAIVSYDVGGPAFESHRTWIVHNEAYLEAETGQRIPMTSQETTLQADGAIGLEYRFDRLVVPMDRYRFIYVAPTLIIDVPISFELKAIPIDK